MTGFVYICFVLAASVVGALLGGLGHFWRAHATMFAEDLGLGEPLDTLTRDNYQFEKHVVGAEWDDAGFWAPDSIRNFIYYVASGFAGRCSLALASGASAVKSLEQFAAACLRQSAHDQGQLFYQRGQRTLYKLSYDCPNCSMKSLLFLPMLPLFPISGWS